EIYRQAGRPADAIRLGEELVKRRKAKDGPDDRRTLDSLNQLALAYQDVGQFDRALPLFEAAASGARRKMGLADPSTQYFVRNLGELYCQLKTPATGEPLLRELVEFQKQKAGADSLPYAAELISLGKSLSQQGKWTEADSVLREALAIREKKEPGVWSTFNA